MNVRLGKSTMGESVDRSWFSSRKLRAENLQTEFAVCPKILLSMREVALGRVFPLWQIFLSAAQKFAQNQRVTDEVDRSFLVRTKARDWSSASTVYMVIVADFFKWHTKATALVLWQLVATTKLKSAMKTKRYDTIVSLEYRLNQCVRWNRKKTIDNNWYIVKWRNEEQIHIWRHNINLILSCTSSFMDD